ncbi:MAG: extracellular solute-binding protein [Pseudomonadota bacterium]
MKGRPVRALHTRAGAAALWAAVALATLAVPGATSGCSTASNKQAPRHITYWEKWTGFEGAAMDAVIDDFNAQEVAHAKADPSYAPIEVEKVTISKIEQKLLIAIAGGNPPDLAGHYSFSVAAYAEHGALTDLGPLLAKSGFERERYIEHYMRLGEYGGKTWALPIVPASTALVFNRRLFKEVGLDPERPPTTIDELDAYAEKLTKWEVTLPSGEKQIQSGYLPNVPAAQKRLIQAGFLPGEPIWWLYGWGDFFGGRLIDGPEKVRAADPANVRAFDWVASYSRKLGVGVIKRFRSGFGNASSPQSAFLSGKVAMVLQGVWIHNYIEKYAPGLQWAAAPFPYPTGHPRARGYVPRGSRRVDDPERLAAPRRGLSVHAVREHASSAGETLSRPTKVYSVEERERRILARPPEPLHSLVPRTRHEQERRRHPADRDLERVQA